MKRFNAYVTLGILLSFSTAWVANLSGQPADAPDLPWSVEIASENPTWLHFKIDARSLSSDVFSGFKGVAFDVNFYKEANGQSLIANERFTLPGDIVNSLQPGKVYETFAPHSHDSARSVIGSGIQAILIPRGGKADSLGSTPTPVSIRSKPAAGIPGSGVVIGSIPAPHTSVTKGNLLWYRDIRRDGTGKVADPKVIGRGGWQNFRSAFSGGNGIIYAITQEGNLLWYRDRKRDGTGEVADPKIIGRGGWQNFKNVFSSGDGVIYAITKEGNLLWYKDYKRDGTGEVANPKIVGQGAWQTFESVFSGGGGIIYAITQDGKLLWYKDAHHDGTGEVGNAKVIGRNGWQGFKNVFSDTDGIIYAITKDGNLLWYRDTQRDGTGEIANPKVIGEGGWQLFKNVFSGGDGIIYAITPG